MFILCSIADHLSVYVPLVTKAKCSHFQRFQRTKLSYLFTIYLTRQAEANILLEHLDFTTA